MNEMFVFGDILVLTEGEARELFTDGSDDQGKPEKRHELNVKEIIACLNDLSDRIVEAYDTIDSIQKSVNAIGLMVNGYREDMDE